VDRESTASLRPEQLARLLAVGAERPQGPPADKGAALGDLLARRLCLDAAVAESLPAVLGKPCAELGRLEGRRLGEVLLDADADLAVIQALKDYAKELVRRAGAGPAHAAATAVYYAAIARALAQHGQTLTQHSREQLQEAFATLAAKPWVPPELRKLFNQTDLQEGE
jgi:hypothetical protein